MPPLPNLLLSNAIMASLLALVAAAVTYYVRRPALSHGLWLLVLLKLLTPPIIPLQVSWSVKDTPATADPQSSLDPAISSNAEPAPISTSQTDDAVTTILIYPAEPESSNPESDSVFATKSNTPLPSNFWSYACESVLALWPGLLVPLWLAGSILWLG